jgi:hypothetical protein
MMAGLGPANMKKTKHTNDVHARHNAGHDVECVT